MVLDNFLIVLSALADVGAIFASGIAIYIFFVKGKSISNALSLLSNYSYQLTLSELKEKLERLNDYNAKNEDHVEIILNIFHEIVGQIKGNVKIRAHFKDFLIDLEGTLSSRRQLLEPKKRALVSELRERLRHLNVESIDKYVVNVDE